MLKEMENLEKTSANTIIFRSPKHKKFYIDHMTKCRYQDVYHKPLVYCLGIDRDTREHVNDIYDFKTGLVNPECLQEGWQTSGSTKIIRMAFNLYCNGMPGIYEIEDMDKQLKESQCYSVENLFCSSYARYFWEAIKIRYPEYCLS